MYIKKMFECGNTIEIEKIHTWKCQSKKFTRDSGFKKTTLAQQKQNDKDAFKKFRRIINANFSSGDYHVVLTYDKYHRTSDQEQAKKDIQDFLRQLRKIYKRRKLILKYVCVPEYGKKSNSIHFHLIINNGVEPGIIASAWPNGGVNFRPLNGKGDYAELASYLMKQASDNYQTRGIFKKRYSSSTNLIIPEPKVEKIKADSWKKDPVIPAGYMLVPDSLHYGVSEVTGYPYQNYRLMLIPNYKKPKAKNIKINKKGRR